MTKLVRKVNGDIVELLIPAKIRTKSDKQKQSIGVFLLTAWIGVMLGFIFLDNLFIGIILAAVVTYLFWMYSSDPKSTSVYVNLKQQTIEKDGVKYQYSNSSKIVLSRKFDRVVFGSSSYNTAKIGGNILGVDVSVSTDSAIGSVLFPTDEKTKAKVSYHVSWRIIIRDGETETDVVKFGISNGDYRSLLTPTSSPLITLAYEIAEVTKLEFIDETGEKHLNFDDPNLSLIDILSKNNHPKFDGNIPESVKREFDVTVEDGNYKITDKDFNLNSSYFIFGLVILFLLAFVLLLFIASLGESSFAEDATLFSILGFWILVLGLLIIPVSNLSRSKNIVYINSDFIRYEKRGLFRVISVNDINLSDLKQTTQFILIEPCLELVSKYVRIPMYGKFDINERDILDDLIRQILVTV